MLAKARTMIAEDEAMIALDLQNMLKNLGYDVSDPASSGAEALALATAERSELASMDIRIKGPIDGGGDRAGITGASETDQAQYFLGVDFYKNR